jgi:CRP/FNR family transcriptional regulator, cyclic AMP receptor protein
MIEVTVASLAEHPFLRSLPPSGLERLAPVASLVRMPARHQIFAEGGYAGKFWLIRSGAVALVLEIPGWGPTVIETLGRSDVLGWSWMFPPYRWTLGAVTTEAVEMIEFDGPSVQSAFDADPQLGYEMTRRFTRVIARRLQATRSRLLRADAPAPGPLHLAGPTSE